MRVKIYGERNTGTNYLSALLDKNLDAELLPGVVPSVVDIVQALVPEREAIKTLYSSLTFARHLGWKHELDAHSLAFINQQLDHDLREHFGYELIGPSSPGTDSMPSSE